jgi:SNF family Na+-dependent transporter
MAGKSVQLDRWATRFGLIMAMSGNAVGLGNFLRFPGKAAPYGGAFMVPYFIALILLGIPLMWIEWTIGRHGGGYGHGSTPGMFHRLWKNPISKYLGVFGVLLPAMIGLYYVYIESWALGYAWKTMSGEYWGQTSREGMRVVFNSYLGLDTADKVSFAWEAYIFFLLTFVINMVVFSRGIEKGIEVVAKYAMPTLLVLGIILAIRVLTLPPVEGRTVNDGLAEVWVIDWSVLRNSNVWIDATGQIFFTLSLGFGMIHTYASYLKRDDDLTLNGLAASSTNEFVEVILGSTIAVPAAVIFFGPSVAREIAANGTFDIGFYSLPVIFQQLPGGQVFGTMWFVLLFLAGLTSSVAMFTPLLLFLQDELGIDRKRIVWFLGVLIFVLMQPVVLFMHKGVLEELDFWAGTYLLVVFAAIEAVVFAWFFGMRRGWKEMHEGADFQVPRIFYPIMGFVTPVYVLGLLGWYSIYALPQKIMTAGNSPHLWLARGMILVSGVLLCIGIWYAWRTRPHLFEAIEEKDT